MAHGRRLGPGPGAATPKALRNRNAVYMRALRRMNGEFRFGFKNNSTDLQERTNLLQPSLECLIARRRLLHLVRVEKFRAMVSHALQAPSVGKTTLPWDDLSILEIFLGCSYIPLVHVPWVLSMCVDVEVCCIAP